MNVVASIATPARARKTLAEELRLQLADEIVRGVLKPGVALDETELARRFEVSRTPVREAIRQLAASGLVDSQAHRGAVVARPSQERLIGMFEAMAELEAMCAGFAAERMTGAERHALEAVHEQLRAMIRSGDPQRYHEVNEAFHAAVYTGSHNDYLAEMTLQTRVRVQPFRRAQFRNLGRLAKSHIEHDRVVMAIMRATASVPPPRCANISGRCARNMRRIWSRCNADLRVKRCAFSLSTASRQDVRTTSNSVLVEHA